MLQLHTSGEQQEWVWQLPLGRQGDSISIGIADVSLVHLEAGGFALGVREPRKVKRLQSLLEGPAFRPGAIVERKVQPEMLEVWCESQERVLVVYWWQVQCALFTRSELKGRTTLLSVGGGPSC